MLNKNCYRWSREICRDCFNCIASVKILISRNTTKISRMNDSIRFNWSNTNIWKRIQLYSVGFKPKDSWMWVHCLLHFRTSCKSFITMSCACLIKCTYGFNWANIGIFFTVPFFGQTFLVGRVFLCRHVRRILYGNKVWPGTIVRSIGNFGIESKSMETA